MQIEIVGLPRDVVGGMPCAWLLLSLLHTASALHLTVTGAGGYLGAEIVWQACQSGHTVRAVARDAAAARKSLPSTVKEVLELDLTDPAAMAAAAKDTHAVIHAASVFRRCDDMETQLVQPNLALAEEAVRACAASGAKLVFTSSMAAVRGGGQPPSDPSLGCYTTADWNSVSRRDGPGFEPYQWSKMETERMVMELATELGVDLVTLCPSMIFGPPRAGVGAKSFSVGMVRAWVDGAKPVESRLVCDVRDVAAAHLMAATLPSQPPPAAGAASGAARKPARYIVSCEARVPAARIGAQMGERLGPSVAERLSVDDEFDGGAIPIGEREVVAADELWKQLGVRCRPTEETIADMAEALVAGDTSGA